MANRNAIDLLDWQIEWIESCVPVDAMVYKCFRVFRADNGMDVGIEIIYFVGDHEIVQVGWLH